MICPACTFYGSNPKDCICRRGTDKRNCPTDDDINRGVKLYTAGADPDTFRTTFSDMSQNGLALLWCAVKVSYDFEQEFAFLDTQRSL